MSKKRSRRPAGAWKKTTSVQGKPRLEVYSSTPNPLLMAVVAQDQRRFIAEPELDSFVRLYAPGEFDEIARKDRSLDLSTITHTLVKRMGPGSEQIRMPLTFEMAQKWLQMTDQATTSEQSPDHN